ncbi:MAG: cell division/cell wall cluster transcriptional repressor MraZ [Bacteroidaceae bacterium]|nr:cell division/cell wall cluster transcriptional repressor MraZ [Bacteroidaceae bacterium]
MMFSGTVTAKMDAKGRVFFPAAFRRLLGAGEQQFVLRRDVHQPCISVYPLAAWEAEVSALRARLNRWDARGAAVFRRFVGDSEKVQLDASGRLLLSRRWVEAAALGHEVAFVGVDDRIEIWAAGSEALYSGDMGADVQALLGGGIV